MRWARIPPVYLLTAMPTPQVLKRGGGESIVPLQMQGAKSACTDTIFLRDLIIHAALACVSSYQIPVTVLCYTSICWHKSRASQLHSQARRGCSDISRACGLLVLAVAMATRCRRDKSHCNIQAAMRSFIAKSYLRCSAGSGKVRLLCSG